MKVEREQATFRPIIITLQSGTDLQDFKDLLTYVRANALTNSAYHDMAQHMHSMLVAAERM